MSDNYISARKKRQEAWLIHLENYESTSKGLLEEWEKIQHGHEKLKAKKKTLMEENGGLDVKDSDMLEVNAGGQVVRVSRETLTKMKGTVLEAMFSGRWENQLQRDRNGRIFLDMNPECFRCIVDHLSHYTIAWIDFMSFFPFDDLENQAVLDRLGEALGLSKKLLIDESNILVDYDHIKALAQFFPASELNGQLRLLYCGTRDGMNAHSFHEKCDNKGPIVVVVKTVQGYIFGGYSGIEWRQSGGYVSSYEAFLFSLNCHTSTNPMKLHRSPTNSEGSLYFQPSYGPCFGRGRDLFLFCPSNSSNLGHTYVLPKGWNSQSLTGSCQLELAEVEVFSMDTLKFAAVNPTLPNPQRNTKLQETIKNACVKKFPNAYCEEMFPDAVRRSFVDETGELLWAEAHLAGLRDVFEHEQLALTLLCKRDSHKIIHLNVSGQSMEVNNTTLGLFPDSVLYKQCVEPQRDSGTKRKMEHPQEWTPVQVSEWIRSLGSSLDISEKFDAMNGKELLSLTRQDIKDLGIDQPGTIALLAESIQKLPDEDVKNSVIFIERSAYCVGKILDHLRLMSMAKLITETLKPPHIRQEEKEKFKNVVEYYFPTREMASHFLG